MEQKNQQMLRSIPSVEKILKDAEIQSVCGGIPHKITVHIIKNTVEDIRKEILDGKSLDTKKIQQKIISQVIEKLRQIQKPYYRRVVNAAGIILHTGLGRAVLAEKAIEQIKNELGGYCWFLHR